MLTVTMLNQKGGVGKTSTCHHLSGSLARQGRRVLLVDNDPQASLTQGFLGPNATRDIDHRDSVAAVYDGEPPPERLIRKTDFEGISLIAGAVSGTDGTEWNMVPRIAWGQAIFGLKSFLDPLRGDFDVCLIDCPPNLHLCSSAALTASAGVVVPLQAEDYGAQGIYAIGLAIRKVQEESNPALALLGYLVTMFDRRLALHQEYLQNLKTLYPESVFEAIIPRAKDYSEAVAARQPVAAYRPRSAASKAIDTVSTELLRRASLVGLESPERRVA